VRKKKFQIKAYVSHEDYMQIEASASRTGLSLSAFARRICLGQPAPSREMEQLRRELLRINADLGRLGGLLKLYLTQKDEKSLVIHDDTRRLLREIEARQRELKTATLKLQTGCRP